MADKKISALTGATTPLAGTEVIPIVQGGVTLKVAVSDLTLGRAVNTGGGTFTNNLVQGTAAKGINFTANTPAAGMTSQLLNWYEEGTWTPTDISGAGLSLTNIGSVYTRIGRQVTCFSWVTFPATTNTSGAAIAGLPFSASSTSVGMGVSCYNSVGFQLFARANGATNFIVVKNDNSSVTNAMLSGATVGIQYNFFV